MHWDMDVVNELIFLQGLVWALGHLVISQAVLNRVLTSFLHDIRCPSQQRWKNGRLGNGLDWLTGAHRTEEKEEYQKLA